MNVLVVGEGKHEEEALQPLVQRLNPAIARTTFRRWRDSPLHVHHGKGDGVFKRLVRFMMDAKAEGFDALIALIDEDGHAERRASVDNAQETQRPDAIERRAFGIAIRTLDAWILADERALSQCLETTIDCQRDPEANRRPKENCRELLEGSGLPLAQAEFYANVIHCADLNRLEERCPRGFAPFAARVRSLNPDA